MSCGKLKRRIVLIIYRKLAEKTRKSFPYLALLEVKGNNSEQVRGQACKLRSPQVLDLTREAVGSDLSIDICI